MRADKFLSFLKELPEFKSILKGIEEEIGQQLVYGITGSPRTFFYAGLVHVLQRCTLIISQSPQGAKELFEELKNYLPDATVYLYPTPEILAYNVDAHSNEQASQRLEVLAALARGEKITIVAAGDSLLRKIIPVEAFKTAIIKLHVGEVLDIHQLLLDFVNLGYQRVDLIEGKGQFSVRGGIVDIYPLNGSPIRFELFDDEIDSIRIFDLATQKSISKLNEVEIAPAHEVFFRGSPEEIKEKINNDFQSQLKKLKRQKRDEEYQSLNEKVNGFFEELDNGIYENLDRWLAYIYPEAVTLLGYLPQHSMVLIDEPNRTFDQIKLQEKEITEVYLSLAEKGQALPGQMRGVINHEDLILTLANYPGAAFSLLPKQPYKLSPKAVINIQHKPVANFNGQLSLLVDEVKDYLKHDYTVLILSSNPERYKQTKEFLEENGISISPFESLENQPKGVILAPNLILSSGFDFPQMKLAVLTDWELFGKRKVAKKPSKKRRDSNIAVFSDLKIGDFVVHVNHGIGKYLGVEKLEISGIHKDYLVVKYAGEDKLYIPTDQVGVLQKYLGAEGQAPKLYKLGGNEWTKVKSKVKKSVQDMAHELLALYAAREKLPGYAFSPDTVWQKEFEEAFPYEETPDQLTAIEELKSDMERTRPMDRLVCGDVGYGKTEVAIRGAFKAIMDGKQVAFLVPTTILAQQHYNTFVERFAEHGISVEMLSRFRSPKEQKKTLENLALGLVDIVIGTHRLVQEDINFKNLGLLIIDEEQRFGVVHKERLKQLKKNIDVLTLTATPIPRTLHMSLVGVRDMSVLETPPEERFPVLTYVVEYNLAVIRDVIRREINRGGQVYFVHNKIMDMEKTLAELESVIPEARIAIAHGRMKEDQLESIMIAFMEGKYDVLLCTTIVETGLDIPNVNTIIVDEADKMGLSQLYQLRGRVGRSNRQAYGYFTYKKDKVLTEVAEKRLHAIREFTEFGSGFKIAMRDLEIRGAGNILGPEQHGDLVSVGFDMYCRLLDEAIQELKGEKLMEIVEPTIDLKVDAFISDDYISDTATKFEFYKKIMLCFNQEDVVEVEDELVDRFGDLPAAVENLMDISRIKVFAKQLRVIAINQNKDIIKVKFSDSFQPPGQALMDLTKGFRSGSISYGAAPNLEIKLNIKGKDQKGVLKTVLKLLEDLSRVRVNEAS